MISVGEAQALVLKTVAVGSETVATVRQSAGCVLSRAIYSPLDLPPFHQSAMDGYAIRRERVKKEDLLIVVGESAAGKNYEKKLISGKAVRIFTGAGIPPGADAVVMQEKIIREGDAIRIMDENLKTGMNIRARGSQIRKGELAMEKGSVVTPAAAGFLASMGITRVRVFKKPSVTILVTGDELRKAGTKLSKGTIFESNSQMLEAALDAEFIRVVRIQQAPDNFQKIRKKFLDALESSDFILFTGGISVGDYDFVGTLLESEKAKEVFYKVKQKPGKPLYFGTESKRYIFGLPGNPASVLTCYYEYVLPAIRKFSGMENCLPPSLQLPVTNAIEKKAGLTHFLKAVTDFKKVTPLEGQESYILKSFARATCLISLPEEIERVAEGERVDVHLLP